MSDSNFNPNDPFAGLDDHEQLEAGLAHFWIPDLVPAIRNLNLPPLVKFTTDSGDAATCRENSRAQSFEQWLANLKGGGNLSIDSCHIPDPDLCPVALDADSTMAMQLLADSITEPMPIVVTGHGFEQWHFLLTRDEIKRLFKGHNLIPDFKLSIEFKLDFLSGSQHRVLPGSRIKMHKKERGAGADGVYRFKQACALPVNPPSAIALLEKLLAAKRSAENVAYADFGNQDDTEEPIPHGTRHYVLRDLAWWLCQDRQIRGDEVIQFLNDFEHRHIAFAADHVPTPGHNEKLVATALKKIDKGRSPDDVREAKYFHLDKHNFLLSFKRMLACAGVSLAFNERNLKLEIKRQLDLFRPIKLDELDELKYHLQAVCRPYPNLRVINGEVKLTDKAGRELAVPRPWLIGDKAFKKLCRIVAHAESRDPVAVRLKEIEHEYKDIQIPDDFLLHSFREFFMSPTSDPDNDLAMQYIEPVIACGIVQRAWEPGSYWSHSAALIGDIGSGKSTYCQSWTIDPLTEWTENFNFLLEGKKMVDQLKGKVVIEDKEAKGIKRAIARDDPEAPHTALEAQVTTYRPLYDEDPVDFPHRHIIIITANHPDVIPKVNNAGNRRIIPAHIAGKRAGTDHRDAIIEGFKSGGLNKRLAAAMRMIKGRYQSMVGDIEKLMRKIGPEHSGVSETALGLIRNRVHPSPKEKDNGMEFYKIKEQCMRTPGEKGRQTQTHAKALADNKLAQALEHLEWRKRQVTTPSGHRVNRWFAPDNWDSVRE